MPQIGSLSSAKEKDNGMKNLFRTLIFNGQVSLTIADTTAIVQEGISRHGLSPASAFTFGKALSAMTFMSACLKMETGEISLAIKGNGEGGDIAVSGNRQLRIRGYIDNVNLSGAPNAESERRALGNQTVLTIIRDDGYNRPFVGSCAIPNEGGMDEAFEEYYRISEQLPTRMKTLVELSKEGECLFAGVIVLQPLPFADKATLKKVETADLDNLLSVLKRDGLAACADCFEGEKEASEERKAAYKCNCSRRYLTRVLVSLGEEQMRAIIKEDGAVRVHCHYCNTDYEFTDEDADVLFREEK